MQPTKSALILMTKLQAQRIQQLEQRISDLEQQVRRPKLKHLPANYHQRPRPGTVERVHYDLEQARKREQATTRRTIATGRTTPDGRITITPDMSVSFDEALKRGYPASALNQIADREDRQLFRSTYLDAIRNRPTIQPPAFLQEKS